MTVNQLEVDLQFRLRATKNTELPTGMPTRRDSAASARSSDDKSPFTGAEGIVMSVSSRTSRNPRVRRCTPMIKCRSPNG